jgi:hypothetical protein
MDVVACVHPPFWGRSLHVGLGDLRTTAARKQRDAEWDRSIGDAHAESHQTSTISAVASAVNGDGAHRMNRRIGASPDRDLVSRPC